MTAIENIVQKHMDAMHEALAEYMAEQRVADRREPEFGPSDFEFEVRAAVAQALLPDGDYGYWWKEEVGW